jgi:hypothetical protein
VRPAIRRLPAAAAALGAAMPPAAEAEGRAAAAWAGPAEAGLEAADRAAAWADPVADRAVADRAVAWALAAVLAADRRVDAEARFLRGWP